MWTYNQYWINIQNFPTQIQIDTNMSMFGIFVLYLLYIWLMIFEIFNHLGVGTCMNESIYISYLNWDFTLETFWNVCKLRKNENFVNNQTLFERNSISDIRRNVSIRKNLSIRLCSESKRYWSTSTRFSSS